MESGTLLIEINWVYFLGIVGALILVAYYSGSRLKAVETDISWLKKGLDEIKETLKDVASTQSIAKDNKRLDLISNASPPRLQPKGESVLEESGIKRTLMLMKLSYMKSVGIRVIFQRMRFKRTFLTHLTISNLIRRQIRNLKTTHTAKA